MKKTFICIALILIATCFFACSPTSTESIEEELDAMGKASMAANDFYDSPEFDLSNEIYPEEWAGCYYGDEKLVVLLTDLSKQQKYIDLTEYKDILEFKEAAYSKNELLPYLEIAFEAYGEQGIQVSFVGIKEQENMLHIGIVPEDYEKAKLISPETIGIEYPVKLFEEELPTFY